MRLKNRIQLAVICITVGVAAGCAHAPKVPPITDQEIQEVSSSFPNWIVDELKRQRPGTTKHAVKAVNTRKLSDDELEVQYEMEFTEKTEDGDEVTTTIQSKALLTKGRENFSYDKNETLVYKISFSQGSTITVPGKPSKGE